jgi:Protein of unknown function (DUF4242)
MAYLIVEYIFEPALTEAQLNRDSAALNPCLDVRGIRRLRTFLAIDRRRGFCEFEAADAETVREAFHIAGVRFERVWAADLYGPA